MVIYDVALWRRFQGDEIPYSSEVVEAGSSFGAVLKLMEECRLKRVTYAVARSSVNGVIDLWIVGRGFWMVVP